MTTPETPATPPAPGPAPVAAAPGKGMTIAGIVFAFLIPLLGLILSIVGLVQNRNAGQKIGANIAGIVISIVWPIVLGIIIAVAVGGSLTAACAGLEPGVYQLDNGGTLTCG
ncbi:MAG: hypothetical protein KF727_11905 [Microbacteriaceae bacterium]|nr:hypothetical protein [Microbacteriaceae bacterium]